jgi:hypothetical protein
MTAGMAGKLLSVSIPWPWTGAEKVDGKAVGYAKVLVGAIVVDAAVIEVDLAKMTVEAAVKPLTETDVALTEDSTLTATTVAEPTLTSKRGDRADPPILTPTIGLTRGSLRGAVIARPQRIETRARNFMLY